jgi:NAD(P)-dependent dehydrogenase (short-subunit alcohol dehydrogenase family)
MTSNRLALVTGAAQGLGLAITEALLANGLRVVAVDSNAEQIERSAAALTASGRSALDTRVADVSQADQLRDVFRWVEQEFGGLDALVNNAGTCFMSDFVDITPDELHRQMAINFHGAFYACQAAIPLMLRRPGIKKIVNISSNGAYNFDVFDPAHYRASKAALDNLTKHLARRYASDGIAVNSVAPAMTRTPLFDVVPQDVLDRAIQGMPRGRPMEPAEVAAWVAFLVSPAGDCASGNVIILNQGRDVR